MYTDLKPSNRRCTVRDDPVYVVLIAGAVSLKYADPRALGYRPIKAETDPALADVVRTRVNALLRVGAANHDFNWDDPGISGAGAPSEKRICLAGRAGAGEPMLQELRRRGL